MQIKTEIITLNKRFPFTISTGTRMFSKNIFIRVRDGQHEGLGECDPGNFSNDDEVDRCQQQLDAFVKDAPIKSMSIAAVWQQGHSVGLMKPLQAALDIALWDLLGKKAGLPLYELLGLAKSSPATSMTIGITPLEEIPSRIDALLLDRGFRALKIKLGSKDGIEWDQQAFARICESALRHNVRLRVDANGGWNLADAMTMCSWLAKRGVEYVEQPLHADDRDALPKLFQHRQLPIYVDESCHLSNDIVRLAPFVDGINIKLMKCGGITEALRMVATARAHGLKTMIGCMSEASVAIAAGASIGSLFDHIDLDSCFNLNPDPAAGVHIENGAVTTSGLPGHGAYLC